MRIYLLLLFIINYKLLAFSIMLSRDITKTVYKKVPYPQDNTNIVLKHYEKDYNFANYNYPNNTTDESAKGDIQRNYRVLQECMDESFKKMSPRTIVNNTKVPSFEKVEQATYDKPNWNDFVTNSECEIGIFKFEELSETVPMAVWSADALDGSQLIEPNPAISANSNAKFKYYKQFDVIINLKFLRKQYSSGVWDYFEKNDWPDEDKKWDAYSLLKHEFGHCAGLDHTNALTDYENNFNQDGTAGGGENQWIRPSNRLMYYKIGTEDKKDITISEEKGYRCIYEGIFRISTTTNYDNCNECIHHEEGYNGSTGPAPINYSLTDFNGKLNWQIENPALANKISGYNIFVKTESGYTSVNKAFIRSGSKAFYSVVPENYDNNSEYRLEVVYKNGLRDFVKFEK